MKRNGTTPYQDVCDSTYSSELLPFGEMSLFRIPLPHTRRTNQKGQSTEVTVDGRRDSGAVDWTKTNAHIIVTENGREIARTVRRLPLSQRVDVSLLKRVTGLPWDGQVWSDVVDLRSWCYLNPRWQRLEKHFELADHLRVEHDLLRFDLDQLT